jgi:hypothetical protein
MRKTRSSGSVRGAPGDGRPYREPHLPSRIARRDSYILISALLKFGMDHRRLLAETVALELLARDGRAVIWRLNLVAADAFRAGYPSAAESLLDIAEAAERAVLRTEGTRSDIHGKAANEP